MLCIPLNLLLSDHLGLEHAGELNDTGCQAGTECVCVCVCVCVWWNQPQVSAFLLLGCISFAFFSRPIFGCQLLPQPVPWILFYPPVSEPCLEKSADCPPVLHMPFSPLHLPNKWWLLFSSEAKRLDGKEVIAIIWGDASCPRRKNPKWRPANNLLGDLT